MGKKK
jgi:vacuole membrane protein 1